MLVRNLAYIGARPSSSSLVESIPRIVMLDFCFGIEQYDHTNIQVWATTAQNMAEKYDKQSQDTTITNCFGGHLPPGLLPERSNDNDVCVGSSESNMNTTSNDTTTADATTNDIVDSNKTDDNMMKQLGNELFRITNLRTVTELSK
mmetsp:Transcript_27038/g.40932  ORF Transcript_27038/g.40932 Transcript_27038/m.40932 type:complete len:146 (-) Transcript_27038:237-674(-)